MVVIGVHRPVKTYLDKFGNCTQCGGRSYMLAANRPAYARQFASLSLSQREDSLNHSRIA
jgi:hypothetical protein